MTRHNVYACISYIKYICMHVYAHVAISITQSINQPTIQSDYFLDGVLRYIMGTSCNVMSCHVMSCHVMTCK